MSPDYTSRQGRQSEGERPKVVGWRCIACGVSYPGAANGYDKLAEHETTHTDRERKLLRTRNPLAIVELPRNWRHVVGSSFEERNQLFHWMLHGQG